MTDKKKILALLCENRNSPVSADTVAEKAHTATDDVKNAIGFFRKKGIIIEECSGSKYRITDDGILSVSAEKCRESSGKTFEYGEIDSTNLCAKRLFADRAAGFGTLITARSQTAGRGRLGRSFYSPADTGLYMSVILGTDFSGEIPVTMLSASAAVAVSVTLEELFPGLSPKIKWVNDIYIDDKKVCGILCEGIVDPALQRVGAVVVGIGVNISTASFPDDISKTAGSVGSALIPNSIVAAAICDRLISLTACNNADDVIGEYRKRSMVIGKRIRYAQSGQPFCTGEAIGIDRFGGLIVREDRSGEIAVLSTGEITLRLG